MAENRRRTKEYMRFIAHSFNELCREELGPMVSVDDADKVFYDIFGVRGAVKKLYLATDIRDAYKAMNSLGIENLMAIFDSDGYRSAVSELIKTYHRLKKLNKRAAEIRKDLEKGKGKKKNREEDMKSYNAKRKEIKYGTNRYWEAVKKIQKDLNIKKNKGGFDKRRYDYLRNFVNKSDSEFTDGGFMDSSNFYGWNDSDDGDDEFVSFYNMAMEPERMNRPRRYESAFDDYENDEDDDEDDEDSGNFEKFLKREQSRRKPAPSQKRSAPKSRRQNGEIPDFISSPRDLDFLNEDEDDDDEDDYRDYDHSLALDPEVTERFKALDKKIDSLGNILSKSIPGVKDALTDQKNDQNDMISRLVGAVTKIDKKIESLEKHDLMFADWCKDFKGALLEVCDEVGIDTGAEDDDEDEDDESDYPNIPAQRRGHAPKQPSFASEQQFSFTPDDLENFDDEEDDDEDEEESRYRDDDNVGVYVDFKDGPIPTNLHPKNPMQFRKVVDTSDHPTLSQCSQEEIDEIDRILELRQSERERESYERPSPSPDTEWIRQQREEMEAKQRERLKSFQDEPESDELSQADEPVEIVTSTNIDESIEIQEPEAPNTSTE